MEWTQLAQDRVQWQVILITVLGLLARFRRTLLLPSSLHIHLEDGGSV